MPKLREIQEQFARHLQGLPTNPDISGQVRHNQLHNRQRLQVYRNNFRLGLTGNLSSIYPVIKKLVGDEFFDYSCDNFIRAHPSRQGNLHEYGKEFGGFLAGFKPARHLAYLPDMASFEWAWHEVFHEADTEPMEIAALEQLDKKDYPDIIFNLHPATRLIKSSWPLLDIWRHNQDGDPGELRLEQGEYRYVIARRKNEMVFQKPDAYEYDILLLLQKGTPLGEIIDKLAGQHNLAPDRGINIKKQVSLGNVCGFTLDPPQGPQLDTVAIR